MGINGLELIFIRHRHIRTNLQCHQGKINLWCRGKNQEISFLVIVAECYEENKDEDMYNVNH